MDAKHFDTLARTLSEASTRRGLLGILATLPILGGLYALINPAETDAKGRRKRRKKSHHHRKKTGNRTGNQKKRRCQPESKAKTCSGTCGQVTNTCEKTVDCGSCACDPPCDDCFICNETTGVCEPDPDQQGDACGEPGQVCQVDGTCACDASSCAPCQTCQGDGACSLPCDGSGCCDDGTCVDGKSDAACGTGGERCVACSGSDTCGGGNPGTPHVCGCTVTSCEAQGAQCGEIADGCGGSLNCGACVAPNICGGGGTPNSCGCTPDCTGKPCESDDGCGGTCSCDVCLACRSGTCEVDETQEGACCATKFGGKRCQNGSCSFNVTFADCQGGCYNAESQLTVTICGQTLFCPTCEACNVSGCDDGPLGPGYYCRGTFTDDFCGPVSGPCPPSQACCSGRCMIPAT